MDFDILLKFGLIVISFFLLYGLWDHFADRICVFTREPHFSYAERIRRMINGRWAKWGLKVEGEYKGRMAQAVIVAIRSRRSSEGSSIFLGIKSYKNFSSKFFYLWQPRLTRDTTIKNQWIVKNSLDYLGKDMPYLPVTGERQAFTESHIEKEFDYLITVCERFERGELEP